MMNPNDIRRRASRVATIRAGERRLQGTLTIPPGASGVVIFAHGRGSSRFSPRNRDVAGLVQEAGLATLLLDLPEETEVDDRSKVSDVALLADRLLAAAEWPAREPETQWLRRGYFGVGTGAGAALVAAARQPELVGAVVSRGGRPDLAWAAPA